MEIFHNNQEKLWGNICVLHLLFLNFGTYLIYELEFPFWKKFSFHFSRNCRKSWMCDREIEKTKELSFLVHLLILMQGFDLKQLIGMCAGQWLPTCWGWLAESGMLSTCVRLLVCVKALVLISKSTSVLL